MFFIAISMSLFFGFISQKLLSNMGIVIATFGILFFVFVAVVFDMIGIAATSASKDHFLKLIDKKEFGAEVGLTLCQKSDRVCSFCADVVGDICSTLCGAAGACITVTLTASAANQNLQLVISILVSAVIAGLTIFFKAIMKQKALNKSNEILLWVGKIIERFFKKNKNSVKNRWHYNLGVLLYWQKVEVPLLTSRQMG